MLAPMLRSKRRSGWARLLGAVLVPCVALAPVSARSEPPPALPAPELGAANPPSPLLGEAQRQILSGDDEAAMRTLTEVIIADPEAAEAYRLRAEVSGRLAAKYSPGSVFRLKQADDLEHVLALRPSPAHDGEVALQLQQAHADAVEAAKQEERRRRLMPAAMSLGIFGGGATLASTTLLVLANTNVGNPHTVQVMNMYSGTFLGIGVALLATAITFGVVARRQYRRDQKALDLFEPRYAKRWRPQIGAGGFVLHF